MPSKNYHIQSVDTTYSIISHDEKAEKPVETQAGIPQNSTLTITPPVEEKATITIATVKGVKGLYVALPKNHKVGSKLIWSKEPYLWEIVLTPTHDHNKHKPTYQFIPRTGEDLYWFDDPSIGRYIIVEDGKHIKPPQSYFKLIPA